MPPALVMLGAAWPQVSDVHAAKLLCMQCKHKQWSQDCMQSSLAA